MEGSRQELMGGVFAQTPVCVHGERPTRAFKRSPVKEGPPDIGGDWVLSLGQNWAGPPSLRAPSALWTGRTGREFNSFRHNVRTNNGFLELLVRKFQQIFPLTVFLGSCQGRVDSTRHWPP